jgi:hypothetical protein
MSIEPTLSMGTQDTVAGQMGRVRMSTTCRGRGFRRGTAIALALVSTTILVAPALAKSGGNAGGNSAASAACENGGYQNWTDAAGKPFRNAGACTSYAAHGNALVPVAPVPVNPFSVTYARSGSSGFQATVTGSGMQPESTVDLFLTWGDVSTFLGDQADASGNVSFTATAICISGASPLTAVSVFGIPAGGEQTEYAVPMPDPTVCPPPA